MNFVDANLVVSAPAQEFWPESNLKEVVLAGRSNVGKSSLINTLCNRKNLAYVGKTPGKTRLLNFFNVADKYMLVDVPGYGYAHISKEKTILFGQMMEDYFANRENVECCVIILDARHTPTQDDVNMIEFVRFYHIPLILVTTKVDKLSKTDLKKNLEKIAIKCGVEVKDMIKFSSVTKVGIDLLQAKLTKYLRLED